jgi:hypothetical protein
MDRALLQWRGVVDEFRTGNAALRSLRAGVAPMHRSQEARDACDTRTPEYPLRQTCLGLVWDSAR